MSIKKRNVIRIFFDQPDREKQIILKILSKNKVFNDQITKARKRLRKRPVELSHYVEYYKKALNETGKIASSYKLDSSWNEVIADLIIGKIDRIPPMIELEDARDMIKINIRGYIRTKNQIIDWVEKNWSSIKNMVDDKFSKKLKRLPKLDRLEYYQRIIELRDINGNRKKPFSEIADKIVEEFPELNSREANVNESSVKNAYHVYKKALRSLN